MTWVGEVFNGMKFDVVIGNPPYQEEAKATSDNPIYHLFMDTAYEIADKVSLITPARFLFNAGKTPKAWNQKMLNDQHLKVVCYEQKSAEIFPNTDIKGGVAVTYRDAREDFGAIGVFVHYAKLRAILHKVEAHHDFSPIREIIHLQNKFNLTTLYADYPQFKAIVGSGGKEKRLTTPIFEQLQVFSKAMNRGDDVQILGLIKNKRHYRWINRKYLEPHDNLDKYKVFVPKSNGSGALGEVLLTPIIGTPLIAKPLVGFTFSFISFGAFDTEIEAEAMLKYVKSKFARTMLGILKITQDNLPRTWAKVPLQNFTPQSDIDWSKSIPEIDQQLYAKYGLNEAEVEFIETKVKELA